VKAITKSLRPPVGDGEFVNPDDGASLVFDTKDKNAITLVLFGTAKFKKAYERKGNFHVLVR